jgi:hypothetical protein
MIQNDRKRGGPFRSAWMVISFSLALLTLAVPETRADSITVDAQVDFLQVQPGGKITDFGSSDTLMLTADKKGADRRNFRYTGKQLLTDFAFSADIGQKGNISLSDEGGGFFREAKGATTTTLTVVQGDLSGLKPGAEFSISIDGFKAGTVVTAKPSVPEPSSLLLLGAGLLAILGPVRRKLFRS